MISQLVETENDLSTWWAPNNYGKRLSQLVGRSALDYYYCGNCALLAVSTTTSSTSIFQTGLCSAKAEGQPKSWIISIVDIVPKKEVFLSAFILQFYAQKRGEKGTAFFSSARASHQKKNQIFSFSLFFWFQMLFSKSWQSPIKPFFTAPPFCACWKVPSTSVLDLGRKKGLAQLSFTRTLKIGALKPFSP